MAKSMEEAQSHKKPGEKILPHREQGKEGGEALQAGKQGGEVEEKRVKATVIRRRPKPGKEAPGMEGQAPSLPASPPAQQALEPAKEPVPPERAAEERILPQPPPAPPALEKEAVSPGASPQARRRETILPPARRPGARERRTRPPAARPGKKAKIVSPQPARTAPPAQPPPREMEKRLERVERHFRPKIEPPEPAPPERRKAPPSGKREQGRRVERPAVPAPQAAPARKVIRLGETITVSDLSRRMGVKASEVIRKLMEAGTLASINQPIDSDLPSLIAAEFGYETEKTSPEILDLLARKEDRPQDLKPRAPVVTVMGHVDHGKTLLLDAIRRTHVAEVEAGGITQHLGAYDVALDARHVVFIDTPGNEAFTALRARGARVTDLVVLVVAADEGVMPQTKEAIDHARAAKVPIVVALNKIDKPQANPERVQRELAHLGLVPEEWGGDTLYARVSAKQRTGMEGLLEKILLQAEVLELKANPHKPARGVVIESRLDRGKGPVGTILIQEGTLKTGDAFVAGSTYGRVRSMGNDRGQKVEEAGPSTPVEVAGFSDVPPAGEPFVAVPEERVAREISLYQQEKAKAGAPARPGASLEQFYEKIKKDEVKELNIVLKGDVQGSVEAMAKALGDLATEGVKINILHAAVGAISENDVNLASASGAMVLGFHVRASAQARQLAGHLGVDIRSYDVIYDAVADIQKALTGLLEPVYRERLLGRGEVIALFDIRKIGKVAGVRVVDGKLVRGSKARVLRNGEVFFEGRIGSLKRVQEDMKECTQGLECGLWIENYKTPQLGDRIESYEMEEVLPRPEETPGKMPGRERGVPGKSAPSPA